jgi:hypothetical protein
MKGLSFLVVFAVACEQEKIALGQGGDDDARMYADVYTWQCEERGDGSGEPTYYEGVSSYEISFEYAPDALTTRTLPVSGCTKGLDLFPDDAGLNGEDIPESGEPVWENGSYTGVMEHKADGFYFGDAYGNVESCYYADELIGEGTAVSDAGVFSGARTPPSGSIADVAISGVDPVTGIQYGSEVTASWTMSGWDQAWVQVRRESMGELIESVTCAVEGSSFTVDDDVWGLMTSVVEADVTDLYITVQNEKTVEAEDGQRLHAATRFIHAAVVQ